MGRGEAGGDPGEGLGGGPGQGLGDESPGGERVLLAWVDPTVCAIRPGRNLAGEPRDEVSLDGVRVAGDAVRVAPADVDERRLYLLGALARSALMAGALERVLELSVGYAGERVQFARPIGRFQAVQQQLAVLAGEVAAAGVAAEAAAAAVEAAMGAEAGDAWRAAADAVAAAKVRTGEAAGVAAAIAHQVHGTIGFTHEHVLHHVTRRLWSWRDEFGTESLWADRLGAAVAARGADALWPFITAAPGRTA
ncbi:MAG: hypothetical protein IRY95_02790 [Clostridia bacterium]|nr:hypothetical protein [Clostridia bacterium]